MELLPDHVLLQVLNHLDTVALLSNRQVCRRWRELALHPSLWRHRRLIYDDFEEDVELAETALLLAPCLAQLYLSSKSLLDHALAASTSCRVAELTLRAETREDAAAAVMVLRNQVSLGGLRALSLLLNSPAAQPSLLGLADCLQG